MNITIQAIQFTADEKLIQLIEKKVARLSDHFKNILDITVFLKLDGRRAHIKDKVVEIRANLPGIQAFSCENDKKFESALDSCLRGLRRQIERSTSKGK